MPDVFVFWLVPVSWVVHDVEELLALPAWRRRNESALRRAARWSSVTRRLVAAFPDSRGTFAVAATLVGLFLLGGTVAGVTDPRGVGLLVFAVCLGGYGLHGPVHVAQAAVFRGYVPGVVTAASLVVPTVAFVYWRLLDAGLLTPTTAGVTAAVGLLLFLPVVFVAGRLADHLRTS
ncbi:HXXEE domain-containing protein [Salinigranum sp.]|uniref:HXXEE domain-containing protein n=1 Tax=Salinigranum sp. TaxID=1966351 RepID=UPI00356546B8